MTSISDLGQRLRMDSTLRDIRDQLLTAQRQQTTGKKSHIYSGFGGGDGAYKSVSLRGNMSKIEAYSAVIASVGPRTRIMEEGLLGITDSAREVMVDSLKYVRGNGEPPIAAIQTRAQGALLAIQGLLNSEADGRFLYAGDDIAVQPVQNAGAVITNANVAVANWQGGGTVAQLITDMQAAVQSQFSPSLAGAGNISVRPEDGVELDYTVKADDPALTDIMTGLAVLGSLTWPNPPVQAKIDEFWDAFTQAGQLIDRGSKQVDLDIGRLGVVQKQLDEATVRHEGMEVVISTYLRDIEDVDVAEALARFNNLQSQMQAGYITMKSLSELSLVYYLR
jgi:flagellin-like hook-associated protein FlgL